MSAIAIDFPIGHRRNVGPAFFMNKPSLFSKTRSQLRRDLAEAISLGGSGRTANSASGSGEDGKALPAIPDVTTPASDPAKKTTPAL